MLEYYDDKVSDVLQVPLHDGLHLHHLSVRHSEKLAVELMCHIL